MSREGKLGKVVVAVKASKEIPKTALVWALTHVVQPGHCIMLLVVGPSQTAGRKMWGFPRFSGDCASVHRKSNSGTSSEQKVDITASCSQMILQLNNVYDPNKVNVKIKVVSGSSCGVVAAEAKKFHASWVVLDKKLKHEQKSCMEELQCNVVIMKKSQPKVLRLNLVRSPTKVEQSSKKQEINKKSPAGSTRLPVVTQTSSPEIFTATEVGTSSVSSSDQGTSPFSVTEPSVTKKEKYPIESSSDYSELDSSPFSVQGTDASQTEASVTKKEKYPIVSGSDLDYFELGTSPFCLLGTDASLREASVTRNEKDPTESSSDSESESENLSSSSSSLRFQPWMVDLITSTFPLSQAKPATKKDFLETSTHRTDFEFSGTVREAISLSRNIPSGPPPLCSICLHKAPIVGKPPRWFAFSELELATGGFSRANFLAEGGFGSVHRGVLQDGQVVAVKQHKLASSQGDQEFYSEVEVLSCAQHRNVVMLIGFCVEDGRRLLVYEYVCNRSLDFHLYGHHQARLEWSPRQKIAVGAARGLRYLHEECRVGCIVHRDLRPNNILITHDFEPLVGDFGLARWQPDGGTGEATRVIGTFGYLAPEYAESGQITEKADVYSFGVVLVELVSGRKAVDLNRPKGQQCLTEWARPLLQEDAIDELIDPRLGNCYSEHEVRCMLQAAYLCIKRDPQLRPRMSQVLRILEGDVMMESSHVSTTPGREVGKGSWINQPQYKSSPQIGLEIRGRS